MQLLARYSQSYHCCSISSRSWLHLLLRRLTRIFINTLFFSLNHKKNTTSLWKSFRVAMIWKREKTNVDGKELFKIKQNFFSLGTYSLCWNKAILSFQSLVFISCFILIFLANNSNSAMFRLKEGRSTVCIITFKTSFLLLLFLFYVNLKKILDAPQYLRST